MYCHYQTVLFYTQYISRTAVHRLACIFSIKYGEKLCRIAIVRDAVEYFCQQPRDDESQGENFNYSMRVRSVGHADQLLTLLSHSVV